MTSSTSAGPRPLSRSLYAKTARPPVAAPPLQGERRTSVAIVGGGYTGLSTALHLAERGIEAVVLESHEPGWGASGRNGGQVNPGLYPNPGTFVEAFGEERARTMLDFASKAPDLVFDLVARHGIDCEAARTGTLRAAINRPGEARLHDLFEQWARYAGPCEWLDRAGIAAAAGADRYTAAIRYAQGGKVNPLGYARGLADAALRAGAAIYGASPATVLQRDGTRWQVHTPSGRVVADHVVLATNGYTDALWPGLKQSVVPVYTTIVASEPLPDAVAQTILPGGPVLYETGGVTIYYRLDKDNRMLMGGRSVMRDVESLSEARHLIDYSCRLWPALKSVSWTHAWNGQVAITPDHRIHLHRLADNLTACVGFNGRGVAMGTAMGDVIARLIASEVEDSLPMPVSDLIPIRFHSLWKPAVTIRLAYGRARDALGF